MHYRIDAACVSNRGLIRSNNEDNFFFNGRCLEVNNWGLHNPVTMQTDSKKVFLAVFDGMGGEDFGEYASFAAANEVSNVIKQYDRFAIREKEFLKRMVTLLNEKVVKKAHELGTKRMGTTIAAIYFSNGFAYVCNVGDSRVSRLRGNVFQQLSVDHVDRRPNMGKRGKNPLSQYLGIDPEEFIIEPYIAKGELCDGDKFLLCSDGVTDMLSNIEISDIIKRNNDPAIVVNTILSAALENGGRDNITVIACFVKEI